MGWVVRAENTSIITENPAPAVALEGTKSDERKSSAQPAGTEPQAEEWVSEEALKEERSRAGPTPRPRPFLLPLLPSISPSPSTGADLA